MALKDDDLLKCGSKNLIGSCNDGVLTLEGDCKLIFVTSDKYSGSEIGGLLGADTICANLAKEVHQVDAASAKALLATEDRTLKGLIGTPLAIIDNNGNSQSRRREIAPDADGMFESQSNYFIYDNKGNAIGEEYGSLEYLWTGSLEDGETLGANCEDWSSGETSFDGTIGDPKLFTYPGYWAKYDGINPALRACNNKYRFLCIVNRTNS